MRGKFLFTLFTMSHSFEQGWKCPLANCLFDQNLKGFDVQDSPSFTSQCKLCKLSHCCDNQCAHYCTGHQNFSPLCVSNVSTVTMKYCTLHTVAAHTVLSIKTTSFDPPAGGPNIKNITKLSSYLSKLKIPRLKLD